MCQHPANLRADMAPNCSEPARWSTPWGELVCHRHAFPSLGDKPLDASAATERAELLHSGALLRRCE